MVWYKTRNSIACLFSGHPWRLSRQGSKREVASLPSLVLEVVVLEAKARPHGTWTDRGAGTREGAQEDVSPAGLGPKG